MVPEVPQQNNAVDCGIFTIAFGKATAEGDLPSARDFQYTPEDVIQDRLRIANRLNLAIRADHLNDNAFTALTVIPNVNPTQPPSPALSASSIHPVVLDMEPDLPTVTTETPMDVDDDDARPRQFMYVIFSL